MISLAYFSILCQSDEDELKNVVNEDPGDNPRLRSKVNPFLDIPHDKKAAVVKNGFLQRKLHADIDGKRSECDTDTHLRFTLQL